MDSKKKKPKDFLLPDEEDVKLLDSEDLLQYFLGEPQNKKNAQRYNDSDTFSLLTFLENDGKRLDKLIHLFAMKLGNHQKYNQTGQLLENQNDTNENLKGQIVDYSLPLFSPVNKSLAQIFDILFKKH